MERPYCLRPLDPNDPSFLLRTTYEFSVKHNRLFLQRPEWIWKACCISAHIFPLNYCAVILVTITDSWRVGWIQTLLLIFTGIKLYAFGFSYYMQFTSDIPPENLIPYWATEGPYLVSMIMVLINIWQAKHHHHHDDHVDGGASIKTKQQ